MSAGRACYAAPVHCDGKAGLWVVAMCGAALLIVGCGSPADIIDAPDIGYKGNPRYQPCNDSAPCPQGQECIADLCKPVVPPAADATTAPLDTPDPGSTLPDTSPPAPDPGPTPPPDAAGPPDPGPTPDPGPAPDTKPPDPGPAACTMPGSGNECDEPFAEVCRVDEATGAKTCSTTTSFKPFGAPCLQHEECDILFACHKGVCTKYCQLQFLGSECPASVPKCLNVGDPVWGACAK